LQVNDESNNWFCSRSQTEADRQAARTYLAQWKVQSQHSQDGIGELRPCSSRARQRQAPSQVCNDTRLTKEHAGRLRPCRVLDVVLSAYTARSWPLKKSVLGYCPQNGRERRTIADT